MLVNHVQKLDVLLVRVDFTDATQLKIDEDDNYIDFFQERCVFLLSLFARAGGHGTAFAADDVQYTP